MTSIHAPIPPNYATAAREAKYRGEDPECISEQIEEKEEPVYPRPRKQPRLNTGTTMKSTRKAPTLTQPLDENMMSDSENEDPASASKENNPSLSPTSIRQTPPSPRKALGKRPLSVLSIPYPDDQDTEMMIIDTDDDENHPNHQHQYSSASEQNISANTRSRSRSQSPRKTPKRTTRKTPSATTSTPQTIPPFRFREDLQIYEDVPDRTLSDSSPRFGETTAKIQHHQQTLSSVEEVPSPTRSNKVPLSNTAGSKPHHSISSLSAPGPAQSKVMKKGSSSRKAAPKMKPRIGVRRL